MKKDRTCKYCNVFFTQEEGRVFSNHIRWCKKNITNGDKGVFAVQTAVQKTLDKKTLEKKGKIEEYSVTCKKCLKLFNIKEWNKLYPQKLEYFCSRSCANSRGPRTDIFKKKISENCQRKKLDEIHIKKCLACETQINKKRLKYCSRSCASKSRYSYDKSSLKYYRKLCSFNFSLKDFSVEFDFTIIEEHGWYKAKNRGNNLYGVSRDHIISVKYGYDNGIDPKIISHPANCQLLRQSENASKNKKCGMTISELMMKINAWDTMYKRMGQ